MDVLAHPSAARAVLLFPRFLGQLVSFTLSEKKIGTPSKSDIYSQMIQQDAKHTKAPILPSIQPLLPPGTSVKAQEPVDWLSLVIHAEFWVTAH
jgi:hypothetical protein